MCCSFGVQPLFAELLLWHHVRSSAVHSIHSHWHIRPATPNHCRVYWNLFASYKFVVIVSAHRGYCVCVCSFVSYVRRPSPYMVVSRFLSPTILNDSGESNEMPLCVYVLLKMINYGFYWEDTGVSCCVKKETKIEMKTRRCTVTGNWLRLLCLRSTKLSHKLQRPVRNYNKINFNSLNYYFKIELPERLQRNKKRKWLLRWQLI